MDKWVKIGVAGSAIWTFLLYLVSNEALNIFDYFYFEWGDSSDDSLPVVLGGCAVIWLVSYLFLRDDEKKKYWSEPVDFGSLTSKILKIALKILKILAAWFIISLIYILFKEVFWNLFEPFISLSSAPIVLLSVIGAVISAYIVFIGIRITIQVWREERLSIKKLSIKNLFRLSIKNKDKNEFDEFEDKEWYRQQLLALRGVGQATADRIIKKMEDGTTLTKKEQEYWDSV